MLVLSRYPDQKVIIEVPNPNGSEDMITIVVEVVQVEGGRKEGGRKVRLGFEAPREVQIRREEVPSLLDRRRQQTSVAV